MCRRRNIKITPDTPVIDVSKLRIKRINSHEPTVDDNSEYYTNINFKRTINSSGSIVSMSHHNEHIDTTKSDSSR